MRGVIGCCISVNTGLFLSLSRYLRKTCNRQGHGSLYHDIHPFLDWKPVVDLLWEQTLEFYVKKAFATSWREVLTWDDGVTICRDEEMSFFQRIAQNCLQKDHFRLRGYIDADQAQDAIGITRWTSEVFLSKYAGSKEAGKDMRGAHDGISNGEDDVSRSDRTP